MGFSKYVNFSDCLEKQFLSIHFITLKNAYPNVDSYLMCKQGQIVIPSPKIKKFVY